MTAEKKFYKLEIYTTIEHDEGLSVEELESELASKVSKFSFNSTRESGIVVNIVDMLASEGENI